MAAADERRAHEVLRETAAAFGTTVEEILSPTHDRSTVAARHAAIRRARTEAPALSSVALGRIFRRDHTSILAALGRTRRAQESGKSAIAAPDRIVLAARGAPCPIEDIEALFRATGARRRLAEALVEAFPLGLDAEEVGRIAGEITREARWRRAVADRLAAHGWGLVVSPAGGLRLVEGVA